VHIRHLRQQWWLAGAQASLTTLIVLPQQSIFTVMTWITVSWLCAVCKQFLLLVVRYIKLIYSWSVHPARQMKTHSVTVTVRSALWVQSKFAVTLPTVTKLILISYSQDGFNWSTHLRYQPMMMMTKLVSCQWPGRACKLTIHSAVAYRLVCTYDFVLPWRKVM